VARFGTIRGWSDDGSQGALDCRAQGVLRRRQEAVTANLMVRAGAEKPAYITRPLCRYLLAWVLAQQVGG
jgi:hypothetical protein